MSEIDDALAAIAAGAVADSVDPPDVHSPPQERNWWSKIDAGGVPPATSELDPILTPLAES